MKTILVIEYPYDCKDFFFTNFDFFYCKQYTILKYFNFIGGWKFCILFKNVF